MNCKKFISCVNLSISNPQEMTNIYYNLGSDGILLWDDQPSSTSQEEQLIKTISTLAATSDVSLMVYQSYARFENIKKIIYAGASYIVMNPFEGGGINTLKEGIARFGDDCVIGALHNAPKDLHFTKDFLQDIVEKTQCHTWMITFEQMNNLQPWAEDMPIQLYICDSFQDMDVMEKTMLHPLIKGLCIADLSTMNSPQINLYDMKNTLKNKGLSVSLLESSIPFDQFKCNDEGLIPVITQDYITGKVLMLAYMNKSAYNETVRSKRMTYYSRSRKCLWKKGETSGHYQYVKSLDIDCDKDTILAKVHQIGPACHTGSESCFFTNLISTEYDDTNPGTILDEIMATVCDRKEHPKEGSYTNYLFDKGIDKILKKVGEEAAEIIIAAKNPDTSELKYEISDFLYHMIVLMAEKGVTWEEVSKELAKRH